MAESSRRDSTLLARLAQHAEERPEAIAVCESTHDGAGRSLTWRALHDAAGRLALRLGEAGDSPVVLLSAPTRIETFVALLGGLWGDAVVIPVPPESPRMQLRNLVQRAGVTIAIGDAELDGVENVRPMLRIRLGEVVERKSPGRALPPVASSSGSLGLQTSGTTGAPKLVQRGGAALDAVGSGCAGAIPVSPDDVLLVAIPLHHSYGIDLGLLTAVTAGCRVELHDGFAPTRVHAALGERGVTILPLVPFLLDVLARSARGGNWPAPRLRRVISAGGSLPRAVFDDFLARFGVRIGQIYGATEFGSVTYSDPDAPDFSPDSVGRPLAGVEIRILDPEAPDPMQPLGQGVEGQVAVRARSMLRGFLGDGASPVRDDFFATGDLGRLDPHGALALTGRVALLVDVGGRKVNPLEVESVLESHPGVGAAAVVPIPYSRTVHRLKALVVPECVNPPSAAELRSFLRERLAPHKIPRMFEMRTSLPRSPTGKLLRQELLSDADAIRAPRAK